MISRQKIACTRAGTHILANQQRQKKRDEHIACESNEEQHSHAGEQRQSKRDVNKQKTGQMRGSIHKLTSRNSKKDEQIAKETNGTSTYKLVSRDRTERSVDNKMDKEKAALTSWRAKTYQERLVGNE